MPKLVFENCYFIDLFYRFIVLFCFVMVMFCLFFNSFAICKSFNLTNLFSFYESRKVIIYSFNLYGTTAY